MYWNGKTEGRKKAAATGLTDTYDVLKFCSAWSCCCFYPCLTDTYDVLKLSMQTKILEDAIARLTDTYDVLKYEKEAREAIYAELFNRYIWCIEIMNKKQNEKVIAEFNRYIWCIEIK